MATTPYLYYENVEAALTFLSKAFGLRKYGPQTRGPDGKINHAAMQLGSDLVMMGRPPSGYRNPKRLGQATQSLYINASDVDKHCERATKAGATIVETPADTAYGHRRYGVTDPGGHEWYFAQEIRRTKAKPRQKRSSLTRAEPAWKLRNVDKEGVLRPFAEWRSSLLSEVSASEFSEATSGASFHTGSAWSWRAWEHWLPTDTRGTATRKPAARRSPPAR
ncbi:MAG: VOC family protein [Gemmatimonadales bacterium]